MLFKLVFCAKYDRGLDLGFCEILKPLKWTNITSFFLIKNKWYNKRVLIWRFTLVLIKINYGQIGDQTGLCYTTNPVFYTGQSVRWKLMFFQTELIFTVFVHRTYAPFFFFKFWMLTCIWCFWYVDIKYVMKRK
jgi:hypothetical protein